MTSDLTDREPLGASTARVRSLMLLGFTLAFLLFATGCGGGSKSSRESVFQPVWSPDGKHIAYLVDPDPSAGCGYGSCFYRHEVWVMRSDGANPRRLARGQTAAWSPDGRTIAFERNFDIYTARANGTHVRRLTKGKNLFLFGFGDPVWSRDGQKLVFVSGDVDHATIYVISADGTRLRRLRHLAPLGPEDPTWLPYNGTIGFTTTLDGLFTVRADGRGRKKVFSSGDFHSDVYIGAVAWSPDGKTVAFRKNGGLYRIGTDGHGLKRLSPAKGPYVNSTSWSPNGRRLAVATSSGIYALNADGTGWRLLFAHGHDLTWSPDGRRIAFVWGGLHVMNADGTAQRRISQPNE
jgi:Tol biopolymer transport system component